MRLTDHDLKQIDQEYLASLSPRQLLYLSEKMLADLRAARDRLNQTPQNSSRLSGSYAPWEQASFANEKKQSDEVDSTKEKEGQEGKTAKSKPQSDDGQSDKQPKSGRKSGKQPRAKGVGRRVELPITGTEVHKASECAGCGERFADEVPFQPDTGLYVLDIERGTSGLQVTHIKHIYGKQCCSCGDVTQTKLGRCQDEPEWTVGLGTAT